MNIKSLNKSVITLCLFFSLKKRKVIKRYGRVEASEMDLLDEIEDDESEEEEELFDINRQRRS